MTLRVIFYIFVLSIWAAIFSFVWPWIGPKLLTPCPHVTDLGAWALAWVLTPGSILTDD